MVENLEMCGRISIVMPPPHENKRRVVERLAPSSWMAGVAGSRIVDIAIAAPVILVGLRARVADRAAEHGVVVCRRVALCARHVVPARQREPRVRERALLPAGVRGPVARLTRRRESGRRVIGVGRSVVSGQVTAHARARRATVGVVGVAVRAREGGVPAHQRERAGVIEGGTRPLRIRRPVARVARRRETGRRMRRVPRRVVQRLMAADAVARRPFVDTVDVAVRAREGGVPAHQREYVGVIEAGTCPLRAGRLVTVSHAVGKPAAAWLGLVVALYLAR